jgi:hypothetical protein
MPTEAISGMQPVNCPMLNYGMCEDIYLYAIAATLDVRIHYELGDLEDDYGAAMMHATTTHIRREDSLPTHRREERLQFFSIAKELYKVREQLQINKKYNASAALKRIRGRLDQETVVDWEWLEDKWKSLRDRNPEPWRVEILFCWCIVKSMRIGIVCTPLMAAPE